MKNNLDSDTSFTIHALIEITEKIKQVCNTGHHT